MATREDIRAFILENPNQMTMLLAKQFNAPEAEIVRAFPENRAVELDPARWEKLIRGLEAFGKVHVIVSNGATTLEAVGQFGGFSTAGVFFNVQTDSLDMHIRWQEIGTIFAVEKPSHLEGKNTFSFRSPFQAGRYEPLSACQSAAMPSIWRKPQPRPHLASRHGRISLGQG